VRGLKSNAPLNAMSRNADSLRERRQGGEWCKACRLCEVKMVSRISCRVSSWQNILPRLVCQTCPPHIITQTSMHPHTVLQNLMCGTFA